MNNNKRKYVVTCDLAKRFSQFNHIGINTPNIDEFFAKFDENLVSLIKKTYP